MISNSKPDIEYGINYKLNKVRIKPNLRKTPMKVKGDIWASIAVFLGAITSISFGIWMIAKDKVGFDTHRLTQQPTGSGGELLILIGILFLVTTYFTLSPFSLIRKFIDKLFFRKKRKTKK